MIQALYDLFGITSVTTVQESIIFVFACVLLFFGALVIFNGALSFLTSIFNNER